MIRRAGVRGKMPARKYLHPEPAAYHLKALMEVIMYVVTGATGNTGNVVANRLLDAGKKVRVIGRSEERLKPFVARGAEAFVADVTDQAALTKAFTGAEGVYAMIPPDIANPDPRGYQQRVSDALAGAIRQSGVKHVVALSSIGADKASGNGPVAGLHEFENKLNEIPGVNVLHLRAGYFMENTLGQAAAIRAMGKMAGPLNGDLKLPLIATRDIGAAVADLLLKLDFSGKSTRELLGQRDLSYNEIAAIIAGAIDKPELKYQQFPHEQIKPVLVQLGMSPAMADLILDMAKGLNSGHMRALETRTAKNTTPTTFETFVKEQFLPLYRGQASAA
ncbi:MAG TPA: NmrA family NAD(P)-binding protein [Candidatus Angelobacter sp.]|nr:NmrA family NAD(P)-binding protein [Candidatus Angelobacter sp.]